MSNQERALEAIKRSAGTEAGEYAIDEFVSHHLEELPESYWQKHLGISAPAYEQVIGLLVLKENGKTKRFMILLFLMK